MSALPSTGHEVGSGSAVVRGGRSVVPRAEDQTEGKPAASVAGGKPAPDDAINLERRVGLLSGVALIVGTMIGE